MAVRIPFAFATSGDKTSVPDESVTDEVSLDLGWSNAYSKAKTEAGYRFIDRAQHNYLWNMITANTKEWQEQAFPEWIADNGSGTPFPYSKGSIVVYTDGIKYISTSEANTGEPTIDSEWIDLFSFISGAGSVYSDSGTANTYEIESLSQVTPYEGYIFGFVPSNQSSGPSTITIDGGVSYNLVLHDGSPVSTELSPGIMAVCWYTGSEVRVITSGASGSDDFVSNDDRVKIALNANGDAGIYACRAWVTFDGTSASINESGNMSSITDRGTGIFTLNTIDDMPDTNVAICGSLGNVGQSGGITTDFGNVAPTVNSFAIKCDAGATVVDDPDTHVVIFR